MLKLRLMKHKNINEAKTFEKHDPTHPEYPDFVSSYCYRLRTAEATSKLGDLYSHITVGFVRPYNVVHNELGFNLRFTSSMGIVGGSQLSFLTKDDAENFAKTYLRAYNLTTYISMKKVQLLRIDAYSDIPCYVESHYIKNQDAEERPLDMSPNLFNRVKKETKTFKDNPFSKQDLGLTAKHSKMLNKNEKLITEIDNKLELMKEICSNINQLVDYKNIYDSLTNKVIAQGIVDKKITDDLAANWDIIYDGTKVDALSAYVETDSNKVFLCLRKRTSYSNIVLYFKLDKLTNNIKDMFSDRLFIKILADELSKIYNYTVHNNSYFNDGMSYIYVLTNNGSAYGNKRLVIEPNLIEFNFINDETNVDNIDNIDLINNVIIDITANVKKAINAANNKFINRSFTLDIFDEDEED